jgi:predicted metal-dependent HD superfamily phosphohydrolase
MDEAMLRTLWARDVDATGGEAVVERVLLHYREPHRQYHTIRHLAAVLTTVDELLATVDVPDRRAVRLAAWFHDAVYDPTAPPGANEEASAALAERVLGDVGVDPACVAEVRRLVGATAGHHPAAVDEAVLVDADLAILSERPAVYDAYRNGVRAEYGHLDDGTWRQGRAAVLQSFLERPAIYTTEPMREREAAARANLTAELASLRGPG